MELHRGQRQILQHRHVRVKIELLEHHAGRFPHELGLVFVGQLLPVDVHMAAGRLFQKVHAPHRGGFARTGRPDDDQLFSLGNLKVDVLQNVQIAEIFVYMFQFDHR